MNKVKKLISILAALSMLLTCMQVVTPVSASVLMDKVLSVNGGFEENIDGWTAGGATCTWTEGGADGSKGCVLVDVTNGFNDISQKVTLEIGKKYYITFKAKLAEPNTTGKTAPVTLLFSYDGKKTEYPIQTKLDLNHETWTKAEVIYTPNSDAANYGGPAKMYIRVGPQPQNEYSFDYYLDDFYCVELNTNENLMVNDGFEYGTIGWNAGGCTVESVDGGANGTAKAAKVTVDSGKSNNNVIFSQSIPLNAEKYYEISFWAKLEQGETDRGVVLMNHEATGKTENILSSITLGTDWKRIKLYYKYNDTSDTGTHRLIFRPSDDTDASNAMNYYYDEVSVRPITENEAILNGDFEYDASLWNGNNAALSISSDTPGDTQQALKVEMEQADGSPAQNVSLKAGQSYTLYFWVKSEDSEFGIVPKIGDQALGEPLTAGLDWNRYSVIYTPEEDIVDQPFAFEAADGTTHTYLLDEIQFETSRPKAENITVSGNALVGETISIDYDFENAGISEEGNSRYRIRMADDVFFSEYANGTVQSGTPIELELTETFENKTLAIDITPVDADGNTGKMETVLLPKVKKAFETQIAFEGILEPNGTLKPSASIVNNLSEDKVVTVIMAVYDGNGTMCGVVADQQSLAQLGGKADFVFDKAVTLPNDVTGYTAKIMIWEGPESGQGVTNMVSLMDSIPYPSE